MLNKPKGCVTAKRDEGHSTVMECFPEDMRERLHPVGRLDLDTEGLLILTDDGYLDCELMQPGRHIEKEYFFRAFGDITEEAQGRIESGIELFGMGHISVPARLEITERCRVRDMAHEFDARRRERWMRNPDGAVTSGRLTITEGKKHQVKLMLKSVGCKVFALERLRIGGLRLDPTLGRGEWRAISTDELDRLRCGRFDPRRAEINVTEEIEC